MATYVDNFRTPARVAGVGGRWSHLTADSPDELHRFAAGIGLRRAWYQDNGDGVTWHYDVTDTKRVAAIAHGAQPIDIRDLAAIISARRRAQRAHTRSTV